MTTNLSVHFSTVHPKKNKTIIIRGSISAASHPTCCESNAAFFFGRLYESEYRSGCFDLLVVMSLVATPKGLLLALQFEN